MDKLNWGKRAYSVFLLCATTAIALQAQAQTFTTLHSFDGADGVYPYAALVQATDGNFYGTTYTTTLSAGGTVFRITPSGTLTTLHSFDGTDGSSPDAGLVQGTNGNFYGTTIAGGANNRGTVFKITPSGTLTTLYSFCSKIGCTDGSFPQAALVQATDGNFYGTTYEGGANDAGTVFKITPSGTLTTLYSFCSKIGCTDGFFPVAALIQATNGSFYGTTNAGGANGVGTVFKITPSGALTTLRSFDGTDDVYPVAALVQATDGDFYGTTGGGGAHNSLGTVFKITPSGTLTTLHIFDGTDGEYPVAALIQATNGSFYGTTNAGGANGVGTVFKITSSGTLTTLHSFDGTDGFFPQAALVQDTNGTFYGTTRAGGSHNTGCLNVNSGCGTVFSLSVGLGPFVETQPTSGKVGAAVKILGTNLTGATSVTFNGTAAVFKVVSSSEIVTMVPAGATTGKVKVVTPHGTLFSNVSFRVLP